MSDTKLAPEAASGEALLKQPIDPGVRIGHVHLKVADIERSLAFYCGVLGFQLTARYGPQAAFITDQFSPRLRYTGSSLAYTVAGVFGGALAPLIFTALLQATGSWVGGAVYLAVACLLTIIGVWLGRNPQHQEDQEYLAVAVNAER